MSEPVRTDMASTRTTVRFVRACRVRRGSTDAIFGAGERASFPAQTAQRLIAAGDAVADRGHSAIIRKSWP